MIPQPETSRVDPNVWAHMTEKQQRECRVACKHRDAMTKAVKTPEALTDEDVDKLGEDLDLVTHRLGRMLKP